MRCLNNLCLHRRIVRASRLCKIYIKEFEIGIYSSLRLIRSLIEISFIFCHTHKIIIQLKLYIYKRTQRPLRAGCGSQMEHTKLFPICVAPIHRITFFYIRKRFHFSMKELRFIIFVCQRCVCALITIVVGQKCMLVWFICSPNIFACFVIIKKKKTKINMKMFDKISASFLHWNGVILIYDVFNLWQLDTCVDNLVTNNLKHFSFPWIATIAFLSPLMF